MKYSKLVLAALIGTASIPSQAEAVSPAGFWANTVNTGDTAAIARLYTDDAVLVSPGTELIAAPGAIGDYWIAKRKSGASDFRVLSVNERLDGDTLYQSAVWTSKFTSNGRISQLEGQMTNVLARQPDGSWKIQLQSWN
jgi:ketosteroid isomerase-like protein